MDEETRARELLNDLFKRWFETSDPGRLLHDIEQTEDGEPIPIYAGTSDEGRGSFRCEFMPLAAMRTLIAESRRIVDEAAIDYHSTETGTTEPVIFSDIFPGIDPDEMASLMALLGMTVILTSLRAKLCDLLEEAFEEGLMVAQVAYLNSMADRLSDVLPSPTKAHGKIENIDAEIKKAADKKRARLVDLLEKFPLIELPRGKGRPTKASKAALLAAIAARQKTGAVVSPVDIAGDIEVDESTVRKAIKLHGIKLDEPE
jgi:hypothetical protein